MVYCGVLYVTYMYTCMLHCYNQVRYIKIRLYCHIGQRVTGEIAVAKQYIIAEFTDFGYNIFEACEKLTDKHSSEYISTELDAT